MDRSTQILVEALQQALAHGEDQRLYKSGKLEGLFPGRTGPAGDAAAQALRDGLLEVVRAEARGRTTIEWVRLTPRGVDFLHDHQSPAAALNELRHALRLNQQAVPVWLEEMRAACTRWRNGWPPTPRSGISGWRRRPAGPRTRCDASTRPGRSCRATWPTPTPGPSTR